MTSNSVILAGVLMTASPAFAQPACLDGADRRLSERRYVDALVSIDACPSDLAAEDRERACEIRGEAHTRLEQWFTDYLEPRCEPAAMARALLAAVCDVPGRECHVQLREANRAYRAGRFDDVHAELRRCLSYDPDEWAADECPPGYRTPPSRESAIKAYELLAKTYIATNDEDNARAAVRRLLFLKPDFTPVDPFFPQPLEQMIPREKDAMADAQARTFGAVPPTWLGIDCPRDVTLDRADVCPGPDDFAGDRVYGPWEIGVQAGFFIPDEGLSGKSEDLDQAEPLVGARVAWFFGSHWAWFADVSYWDINTDLAPGDPIQDSETLVGRSGVEWLFGRAKPNRRLPRQWFVAFGGGLAQFDLQVPPPAGSSDPVERALASAGIGQRLILERAGRARVRWEVRVDHTLEDEGFGGESITHFQFVLGLNWMIGGGGR